MPSNLKWYLRARAGRDRTSASRPPTRLHRISTSRPRRRRNSSPRNIHVAAEASAPPQNIHVAASPRLVEYPRGEGLEKKLVHERGELRPFREGFDDGQLHTHGVDVDLHGNKVVRLGHGLEDAEERVGRMRFGRQLGLGDEVVVETDLGACAVPTSPRPAEGAAISVSMVASTPRSRRGSSVEQIRARQSRLGPRTIHVVAAASPRRGLVTAQVGADLRGKLAPPRPFLPPVALLVARHRFPREDLVGLQAAVRVDAVEPARRELTLCRLVSFPRRARTAGATARGLRPAPASSRRPRPGRF